MSRTMRGRRSALALAAVLVAAPGCASLGGVLSGVGIPGAHGDVLEGQVRSVDARRGRLSLRAWDGRTRAVHVHRDTPVRYDGRTYPVSALERGDEVRVYLTWDRRGEAWAERVDVRRSVRERDRYDPRYERRRVERLEGYLTRLNLRDGWLAVDPRGRGRSREVIVHLPPRLDRDDERWLRRVRRGDRVRMDVVPLGRDEAELVDVR